MHHVNVRAHIAAKEPSFFRVHHFIKIVNKFVLSQQIGLSTNLLALVSSLPVFIRNLKTLPTRQAINAALCVISWHRLGCELHHLSATLRSITSNVYVTRIAFYGLSFKTA